MVKHFNLTIVLLSVIFLASCEKENEMTLEEYLVSEGIQAEKTADGIYYIIEKQGNREKPSSGSMVTVHYEGFLINGTMFDSSIDRGKPITISLFNVIEGWRKGIPLFGKGGKGKLFIPPSLGYGNNVKEGSKIPKNSILIFDIELLDFQ